MKSIQTLLVVLVALSLLIISCVYIVDEKEYAIKLQLGQVQEINQEPGLQFKIPFFQEVKKLDKRLQYLDLDPSRFLTSEQKYMIVDSFVEWKVNDVVPFFTSFNGDFLVANQRLGNLIDDALRSEFSKKTVQETISEKRAEIMQTVQKIVNEKTTSFGILVTDVRVKRVDFPDQVRNEVFRRMAKGREKEARELRSQGEEQAKVIRAGADRMKQEILAQAYKESEEIRGDGDAKSAEIYAKAYGSDREFYRFYRSLNAYKASFKDKGDVLVIEPDSEFFKYFNNAKGK